MSGIFDLSKLLEAASNMDDARHVDRAFVKSIYDDRYYSEQTASFDDVLYAASCLDLLDVDGSRIRMSKAGREFVGRMSVRDYKTILNGNDEQKQFLLSCLGAKRIRDVCGAIFRKFRMNYADNPPVWNSRARVFDHRETYILEILENVGVVHNKKGLITIDIQHIHLFSMMKNEISVNLDAILERKKQVGDIGEDLTMTSEMNRLAGYGDLADRVKQVSLTDPYAGYDIASFDGYLPGGCRDRFIEVKATSGTQPKFFWSSNEINKARKYGDMYWIYLWTDIDGSQTLHTIQNPYVELFETGDPKPKPASYLVDKQVLDQKNIVVVGDTV